jgi:diguanylate cyclase (GGDEF)-like protein
LGRSGYVYLFDQTRLMIIHPDPKRILQRDIPPGANKVLDQAIAGYEGIGETVNSRGVQMLLSFRRVPGTSWIIGAQIPRAEAFEALSFSRRVMLVTTVFSILIIVAVSILMVRHFARPLGHLSEAARAIMMELGGGPFASGVIPLLDSIRAKDETGILANTFRELVARQRQSLGMLRRAASEWERTFDAVNEAVLCLDRQGRILRINRMAALWFRVSPDTAVGHAARTLVLGDDSETEFWPEAPLLDVEHALTWTGRLQQREGIFEFRASPVVQDGAISGMILSVRDFTLQAQKEEDTRKRAFFDVLTGLPNRALLMDRLQQALAAGARSGLGVGVIFLDLDHFKATNDTLGHDAGDALLKEVAHRLAALVRKNDTVSRLGGDEFVIVISEALSPQDAELVATKVIQSLSCPFSLDGHELSMGASIGIAHAPTDGADGATLLKYADAAMYQAKREGRSSFRVYAPTHPASEGGDPV